MNSLNRFSFAAALAACTLLAGCMGTNKESPTRPQAVERIAAGLNRARPALDDEAVKGFGFQTYWDSYIRDEVISSFSLEGDQIYAFTQSERLYQVDMHSGMVNWVFDVGRPLEFDDGSRPITEFTYEAGPRGVKQYDEIFFVAGDYLYAVDKKNGSELWTTYLNFTPSSAPQASRTHVFIGSWNDRVYAIRKDAPSVPDWSWRTGGDVLARPVVHGTGVFVSSTDGKVHSFEAATGRTQRPFRTDRQLKVDAMAHKSLLYIPAEDYNLYVVGTSDGLLHHRVAAGAPVTTCPVAIDKSIYFAAENQGMFALLRGGRPKKSEGNPRKTSHKLLWRHPTGAQVLCKGVRDIYLRVPGEISSHQTVEKVSAKDGHVTGAMDLTGVDFWITNPFSPAALEREEAQRGGIVFLGFRNGWIFALKETATIPGA